MDDFELGFLIVAGVLDHSLPLIVLMIDFTYNCIPFIGRHFKVTFFIILIYAIFNVSYSIAVEPIYPVADFDKAISFVYPVGGIIWCVLMFYFIMYINRIKLKRSNKNIALVQLGRIKETLRYQKRIRKMRKAEMKRIRANSSSNLTKLSGV